MEELILKLKQEIIEVLNLEDVKPEDIDNDAPLFGEGLGLDSIDALELGVALIAMLDTLYNTSYASSKSTCSIILTPGSYEMDKSSRFPGITSPPPKLVLQSMNEPVKFDEPPDKHPIEYLTWSMSDGIIYEGITSSYRLM